MSDFKISSIERKMVGEVCIVFETISNRQMHHRAYVYGQYPPCGWGRTEREAYNDLRHWYKRRHGVSLIELE